MQGFPKLTKSCSHFPKILSTSADLKSQLHRKKGVGGIGFIVLELVAKVKDTVANGLVYDSASV